MSVEFRTVYASKTDLAADRYAATAAHSRAVDHDGVEGNDSLYAVRLSNLTNEFHHSGRANSDDFVIRIACVDQCFQFSCCEALLSVRAIVRSDVKICASRAHFIFKHNDITIAEACDHVDFCSCLMDRLGNGICDGASDAATYNGNASEAFRFRRLSERTCEILNKVAFIQSGKLCRGASDRLKHNRDCAALSVIIGNGKWDSFAEFIDSEDDELSCKTFFCDKRRFHDHFYRVLRRV